MKLLRYFFSLFFLLPLSVTADDACWILPPSTKPSCNIANKTPFSDSKSFGEDLIHEVISNLKSRKKIEGEFFWDFLKDQAAQTNCESTMLTALDILPGRSLCPDDAKKLSLRDSIKLVGKNMEESAKLRASDQGSQLQKTILQSVWRNLPDLASSDAACSEATSTLKSLNTKSHRSSFGMHGETAETMGGIYDSQIEEQNKMTATKCALRDKLFNRIWSGNSPEMQGFLKEWISRDRFLRFAPPNFSEVHQRSVSDVTIN